MNNSILIKKFFIKIFIYIILLIVAYFVLYFLGANKYNSINYDNLNQNGKFVSMLYIDKFMYNIENNKFDTAYSMLSDDCKINIFNSELSYFQDKINSYRVDNRFEYSYNLNNMYLANTGENVYVYLLNIGNEDLYMYVYEYSPFEYKLYLVID